MSVHPRRFQIPVLRRQRDRKVNFQRALFADIKPLPAHFRSRSLPKTNIQGLLSTTISPMSYLKNAFSRFEAIRYGSASGGVSLPTDRRGHMGAPN